MKPAIIVGERSRTAAQLDERAGRLAAGLRSLGAGSGDRVAVMLPNGFEFFEVQAATHRLGAGLVPVNWHLRRCELRWILDDSEARVLVVDPVVVADVDVPPACAVVEVGDGYERLLASAAAPVAATAAPVTTLVLYTSGTEGRPKGVVHEVGAGAGRTPLADLWGFTADDVHVLAAPAYHGAPWSYASTHLAIGATIVVQPRWDPAEWCAPVARHRVTTAFLVPAQMARIAEATAGHDLSSLRLVLHGGAPCPSAVKQRFVGLVPGAEVWEFYGFSEGGRATRISTDEWRARPGSVGRPFPRTEVRILDESGRRCPPGVDGLVYVVPPGGTVFKYHRDPAATARVMVNGAVTGGDVGHLDDDGYLWITDRAADMVIRGGVNIYPREIEDVLHEHLAVRDCAVIGVPDPVYGEQVLALVETSQPVTADELRAHCRALLSDQKCPAIVEFVDTLPRDPNGKVRKRHLRDERWTDQPSAVRAER